ncbi:hypothetical protein P171DRAFT_485302 [Karstenula rhodostoma CBS 690.94]|uniref:C3H1-type domain-containing protein n=1 Tax=Karstenula rhodostoma CBS 690.94 TaxID=1392251 RepID=A0A9P4PLY5_9PLEO|nr:hypothetical protein P171DRAFT_485302 [Karstenula rhodostoma CBS 690.94]
MVQNHLRPSISPDGGIALDMSELHSTEGGIEPNSNTASSLVVGSGQAVVDTTLHPYTTEKNKSHDVISQRVAYLEKQNAELNAELALERRVSELRQKSFGLQRQASESRISLLSERNNAMWNNFETLSDHQRRRNLQQQNALKRDLRDMANLARHRAGLPPLNSGDSTGAICNEDDEYDSDVFDISNTGVRYKTRSVETSWRTGTADVEANPEDNSNIISMFESLPKLPLTLPNISSRLCVAKSAKGIALSDIPAIPQRSDFPARIKRTAAQSDSPPESNTPRFPVCIQCYVHNRRCDPGVICNSCFQDGKACKRAACKYYADGLCLVQQCTKAHEKDEAAYGDQIVEAGHVQKLRDEKDQWNHGYDSDDGDGGVEHIPKRKRKRPKTRAPLPTSAHDFRYHSRKMAASDSESGSEHDSDYECDTWELLHRLKQERKRRARLEDAKQVLKSEKIEAHKEIDELSKAKSGVDHQVEGLVKGFVEAMTLNDVNEVRTMGVKFIEAQGISLQGRLLWASEDTPMRDGDTTAHVDTNGIDMQKFRYSELQIRKKAEEAPSHMAKDKVRVKHAAMEK